MVAGKRSNVDTVLNPSCRSLLLSAAAGAVGGGSAVVAQAPAEPSSTASIESSGPSFG